MALTPGTRIGSYEIAEQIGAGGMGEVYRATDTKLKREVAIKVLPEPLAADAERLARFQREAEVLAALNHPGIAHIYGIEEAPSTGAGHAGSKALVMELVEGPTLADRIAKGPIPVDEALAVAGQIADALAAAHERGIVHRDLKPANVKVRPDGTVKVLDFGLAKALEPAVGAPASQTLSPTITTPAMTQAGLILGTAAYMAPEQAKGRAVDARADVWAFGALLFEMLSGRQAFDGEDVADVLGAVVRLEPDWSSLPATVPGRVEKALRVCLVKDPRKRAAAIHDVRLALDGAFETAAPLAGEPPAAVVPGWQRPLSVAASAFLAGALLVGTVWALWPAAPREMLGFRERVPDGQRFGGFGGGPALAASPDDRRTAYRTDRGIYVKDEEATEYRLVPGTELAQAGPFFSPDGERIAFWEFETRQFKSVRVDGGGPIEICEVTGIPRGAHWTDDGTILFARSSGIGSCPAGGGERALEIPAADGEQFYGPRLLPDGDGVLFTVAAASGIAELDAGQLVVYRRSTEERTVIIRSGGVEGRVLPSGYLTYVVGNALRAVAFDLATYTTSGEVESLVADISRTPEGGAHVDVTNQGMLVYLTGQTVGARGEVLAWADDAGELTPALGGEVHAYRGARISPDGLSLAVVEESEDSAQLLVIDIATNTRTPLTDGGTIVDQPVWTPDQRVAFRTPDGIMWRRADVGAPAEELWAPGVWAAPLDFFSDELTGGLTVLFAKDDADENADLWTLSLPDGAETEIADRVEAEFLVAPGDQVGGRFSPDGAWVAFRQYGTGDGSGILVAPFPGPGGTSEVYRSDGAPGAVWSLNGQRLYFGGWSGASTNWMFASNVETAGEFRREPPMELWNSVRPFDLYDIHPDDGRFLLRVEPEALAGADQAPPDRYIVSVRNWVEELKRRVPTD